jgi:hypothetical protein
LASVDAFLAAGFAFAGDFFAAGCTSADTILSFGFAFDAAFLAGGCDFVEAFFVEGCAFFAGCASATGTDFALVEDLRGAGTASFASLLAGADFNFDGAFARAALKDDSLVTRCDLVDALAEGGSTTVRSMADAGFALYDAFVGAGCAVVAAFFETAFSPNEILLAATFFELLMVAGFTFAGFDSTLAFLDLFLGTSSPSTLRGLPTPRLTGLEPTSVGAGCTFAGLFSEEAFAFDDAFVETTLDVAFLGEGACVKSTAVSEGAEAFLLVALLGTSVVAACLDLGERPDSWLDEEALSWLGLGWGISAKVRSFLAAGGAAWASFSADGAVLRLSGATSRSGDMVERVRDRFWPPSFCLGGAHRSTTTVVGADADAGAAMAAGAACGANICGWNTGVMIGLVASAATLGTLEAMYRPT